MQFVVSKQNLQKELGFVQGVVEKKNTIPVLSNILIESVGEGTIRITGTDLDVTIRCEMDAEEISTPGSMCVQARKLFEIARLLPDAPVTFKKEENEWVTVKCDRARFKMVGVARDAFPELPSFKSAPTKLNAGIIKTFEAKLKDKGKPGYADVKQYEHYPEAYQDLLNKRIDAVVNSKSTMLVVMKDAPGKFKMIGGVSDITAYFGMAFRKEDAAFHAFVNEQLGAMKKDGTLAKLQEKWFGSTMDTPDAVPEVLP